MPSTLEISIYPSSTASANDYELLNTTIEFSGAPGERRSVQIAMQDDTEIEGTEYSNLNFVAPQ